MASLSMIREFLVRLVMAACMALICGLAARGSEVTIAPEYANPDDRYKADVLLIAAHPDDETVDVAGYLARAILDEHRRAAVVYTTRGEAGDNANGNEHGSALGMEREMEARQALAILGVKNVWFLNAPNTDSHNVLSALEYMDHGSILGQVVRLIRLTRPEVIVTWVPIPVAGENHADHQAASVVANEAFDLAGDPSAFGEQVQAADTDDPGASAHDPEGLRPWQPQKLYFYSDSTDVPRCFWRRIMEPSPFRKNFVIGAGPMYSNTDISPTKGVPYSRLIAQEASFYLTQDGAIAKAALTHGDFKDFECPTRFIFGKSLVGGSLTADIFEGVTSVATPFVHPPRPPAHIQRGVSLTPGGQWEFYREFWSTHGLQGVADLLPLPEFAAGPGRVIHIPLIIRNATGSRQKITLTSVLPDGWTDQGSFTTFPLLPNSAYPVHRVLTIPATSKPGWYEVTWKAEVEGRESVTVAWRVYVPG